MALSEPFNITLLNNDDAYRTYILANAIVTDILLALNILVNFRTGYIDLATSEEITDGKKQPGDTYYMAPFSSTLWQALLGLSLRGLFLNTLQEQSAWPVCYVF